MRTRLTRLSMIAAAIGGACLGAPPAGALAPPLNVADFGARADDRTDNSAAFQRALDAAGAAGGGAVHAGPGRYRFAGHLKVPQGVVLTGTWQGPPSRELGTVLLPTEGAGREDGPPFIVLDGAAGIKGLVVSYPEQRLEPPPTPYPWTIRGLAQDCRVEDVLLVRPYNAIDFGTFPCSRHVIRNVFGSPLRRGIYIDGSVDVGRVSDVHFSTFFFPYQGPLDRWKLANAEAFIIGKADWEWFENCFAIGYAVGFRFVRGKGGNDRREGPPNYVALTRCGIDESGLNMVVEECSGLTVSQCVFKGLGVRIQPTSTGPVKFAQCFFSPMPGTKTLVEARGLGRVSFTDCTFEFWDTLGDRSPALLADCGSLLVQGCEFGTDNRASFGSPGRPLKRQVVIGASVRSGVVSGNRMRYGVSIQNSSRGRVLVRDNVTDNVDAYRPPDK